MRQQTSGRGDVFVCRDLDEASREAARLFSGMAAEAIERKGRFTVSLSGGSTPQRLYETLAAPPYRDEIDWSGVHLFWTDERCVPPDDGNSNFRMVNEAMLSKIAIPTANIHRMRGEDDPLKAAYAYECELRDWFTLRDGELPRFDLLLLGMGADGHTASLFPGSTALEETKKLVCANFVREMKGYRMTMTFPVINNAALVGFLITGRSKAPVLNEVLASGESIAKYPVTRVRPTHGTIQWFVDEEAVATS